MPGVEGFIHPIAAALPDGLTIGFGAAALAFAVLAWISWRGASRWKREVAKIQSTLEAIDGAILVTDPELRIVDCNRSARQLLGLGKTTRRKASLLDRLTVADGITLDKIGAHLEHSGSTHFEAETRVRDAKPLYLRARLTAMDLGGHRRIVILLENLSEQREQALQYESFLEYLIKYVPTEVTILSPDGRYQYLSSSFITDEAQREWLIGRTDFDYCRQSGLHIELALRRRSHRMEAIDRKETVFFEEEVMVDGKSHRYAWQYCPFTNEEGQVTMILGFGVDQSELVQCRRELTEARGEAQKAVRLRDALLQNVSHEIRTPLSGIIGTAQMLQSEATEELRSFLQDIEDNGRRLAETLNGMLDLAGLQAENIEIKPEIVNLTDEMEELARSARADVEEKGLFLRVSSSHPEILTRADRGGLARAFKNLIDNALKFTTEGGILIDLSQSNEYAYIRVMDTGVGIEEESRDDVFDAFSQEDEGLNRHFEGVGLGLTLTQRLVAMMDGDIRVHSRKGAGSSFVVRLPLVMPELRRRSGLKARVLIADPQRETHRIIRHMLGEYFEFESAHTLAEAAVLTGKQEFEAVFVAKEIDPDLDSREVLSAFREGTAFRSSALIIIDEHRLPGRRTEFLDEGWHAYVSKPLEKLELMNVLYAHTGHAAPVI